MQAGNSGNRGDSVLLGPDAARQMLSRKIQIPVQIRPELLMTHRLINDVIKPWEELNALLTNRFAFQPELSDVTRLASALAVSIKHQAELRGMLRNVVDGASEENRLMSDVADAAKHGTLRDPARNNKLSVASWFEYAPGKGFRFIRNAVTVAHASFGEKDFMASALGATQYWMRHVDVTLNRTLVVSEATRVFFPTAHLTFNPKYCFNMTQVQLKFFSEADDGTFQVVDPPEVRFELFEAK